MKTLVPLLGLLVLAATSLHAQVPQLLEYDGYLLEKGKPVTGNRTMAVRLYDAGRKGKVLYTETIGKVSVVDGEFYFQYGAKGKGIAAAFTAKQHWLAVVVDGREQSPRAQLLSVPFALASADAQNLAKKIDELELEVQKLKKNTPSAAPMPTPTSLGAGIQFPWSGLNPTIPSSGSVIQSKINGSFSGWSGSTVVSLTNGQIWKQSSYYYEYDYSYMPNVTIIQVSAGHQMFVDGIETGVRVERIR